MLAGAVLADLALGDHVLTEPGRGGATVVNSVVVATAVIPQQ
ncbi:hypothetical protein AB0F81_42760 [Actinoplanes sp. NPDC024001]